MVRKDPVHLCKIKQDFLSIRRKSIAHTTQSLECTGWPADFFHFRWPGYHQEKGQGVQSGFHYKPSPRKRHFLKSVQHAHHHFPELPWWNANKLRYVCKSVKKILTRLYTHYTHYFFANTIISPSMDLSAVKYGFYSRMDQAWPLNYTTELLARKG